MRGQYEPGVPPELVEDAEAYLTCDDPLINDETATITLWSLS